MLQIVRVPLKGIAPYRPLPFRPHVATRPSLGQTQSEKNFIMAAGVVPLLVGTAIGGGMAYVGYRWFTSTKEGWQKVVAFIIGGSGAIGALVSLAGAALWGFGVNAATSTSQTDVPSAPLMLPSNPSIPAGFPQQSSAPDVNSWFDNRMRTMP